MSTADFRERVIKAGSEPSIKTPEELLQKAKAAAARLDRVIRDANIRAE